MYYATVRGLFVSGIIIIAASIYTIVQLQCNCLATPTACMHIIMCIYKVTPKGGGGFGVGSGAMLAIAIATYIHYHVTW